MSLKHFEEYYNEISNQYVEMLNNLKEMQDLVDQGMVSPERIENLEKMIQPVKDNYMTVSYIKFLLSKPNRKEKQARHEKQMQKFLNTIDKSKTKDSILKQNKEIIDSMHL